LVAVAIGKLDALVFAVGIFLGVFVFGDILFPVIKGFYYSGDMGKITLPDWLGINAGVVAFGVVVIAVAAFWLAEKAEKKWDPYKNMKSSDES